MSNELGRRKKMMEMILRMIILLRGEIRYGNKSLYDAFTGASGKLEGKYREFFILTAQKMKEKTGDSFGTIFRESAGKCLLAQLDQARGMNRALIKLVEQVIEKTPDSAEKVLAISHCNCPARAQVLKEAFEERMKLAKIVVLDTAGVSSMYANDGGVIVAV